MKNLSGSLLFALCATIPLCADSYSNQLVQELEQVLHSATENYNRSCWFPRTVRFFGGNIQELSHSPEATLKLAAKIIEHYPIYDTVVIVRGDDHSIITQDIVNAFAKKLHQQAQGIKIGFRRTIAVAAYVDAFINNDVPSRAARQILVSKIVSICAKYLEIE